MAAAAAARADRLRRPGRAMSPTSRRAPVTFREMQRRQLRLSITLAIVFLASVFSIPVLNLLVPDAMLTPVLGIPFVWLYVGILLHAEFWTIAVVYTVLSNRWERQMVDEEDGGDD
jgi:uncharacterized membrane protein (DUF485 family)